MVCVRAMLTPWSQYKNSKSQWETAMTANTTVIITTVIRLFLPSSGHYLRMQVRCKFLCSLSSSELDDLSWKYYAAWSISFRENNTATTKTTCITPRSKVKYIHFTKVKYCHFTNNHKHLIAVGCVLSINTAARSITLWLHGTREFSKHSMHYKCMTHKFIILNGKVMFIFYVQLFPHSIILTAIIQIKNKY